MGSARKEELLQRIGALLTSSPGMTRLITNCEALFVGMRRCVKSRVTRRESVEKFSAITYLLSQQRARVTR
jgi:hypothetical protein